MSVCHEEEDEEEEGGAGGKDGGVSMFSIGLAVCLSTGRRPQYSQRDLNVSSAANQN